MVALLKLPEEVLVKVFENLAAGDLCRVALVCSKCRCEKQGGQLGRNLVEGGGGLGGQFHSVTL